MGQNSRYSSNIDAEIARNLMRQEPILLTAAELEFDRNPPHRFDTHRLDRRMPKP